MVLLKFTELMPIILISSKQKKMQKLGNNWITISHLLLSPQIPKFPHPHSQLMDLLPIFLRK